MTKSFNKDVLRFIINAAAVAAIVIAASRASSEDEFVAAYAADQASVNGRSMRAEGDQFLNLANWKGSEFSLAYYLRQRDFRLKDYNHKKELLGTVSQDDIDGAYMLYQESELSVINARQRFNRNRIDTELARLRILEEGNPQNDYRRITAQTLIRYYDSQIEGLQIDVRLLEAMRTYYKKRFENGKILFNKKLLPEVELERRRSDLDGVDLSMTGVKLNIEAMKQSADGARKNLGRL